MIMLIKTLAAVAAGTVLATNTFAQSTREVRGASPYVAIENEPPPKLIVDPTPLAEGRPIGLVWIQYRVENVHIVPVFGAGALNVSPRIGHLHIHVDDLPWGWVEASDNNTISVAAADNGNRVGDLTSVIGNAGLSMILGMSIGAFTLLHVVITLVAIGSGLIVVGGMFASHRCH
jgi:hypothetical protein